MADLRTHLSIYLRGDAAEKAGALGKAFERLGVRSQRALGLAQRGAAAAGRGIDRLANRWTAIAGGAAGVGAAKMVGELDTRMTYLGIQAGKTADQIDALKKEIFETALMPDIRVDPTQILNAVEDIVERTGDLELARQNIRNIGLTLRATGAEGRDVGTLIAGAFEKMKVRAPEDIFKALDTLTVQGKAGAFTLAMLATQSDRLFSAAAVTGRTGLEGIREMGAAIQSIKKGVGSADQAVTAYEAFNRTMRDADKVRMLRNKGIDIVDPNDKTRLRDINAIMKDIARTFGGNQKKMQSLSNILDAEAMRAINAHMIEFQQTGGFRAMDEYMNVVADGTAIMQDAARAAEAYGGAMTFLSSTWKVFADSQMVEPIRDVAKYVNSIDPKNLDTAMKALVYGGGAVAGFAALRRLGVGRFRSGAPGAAGAAAAGLGGLTGPTPVVVVNWPPGFGGGATSPWAPGKGRPPMPGARTRAAGAVAKIGGVSRAFGRLAGAMPLLASLAYAPKIVGGAISGDRVELAGGIGGLGGTIAGAAAGAAIGSIVPVIGTAIGGLLGAMAGAFSGERLGEAIAERIGRTVSPEVTAGVHIKIDSEGRPRVASLRAEKGVELDVDTGLNMVSP